jgi:hypothetical protein
LKAAFRTNIQTHLLQPFKNISAVALQMLLHLGGVIGETGSNISNDFIIGLIRPFANHSAEDADNLDWDFDGILSKNYIAWFGWDVCDCPSILGGASTLQMCIQLTMMLPPRLRRSDEDRVAPSSHIYE